MYCCASLTGDLPSAVWPAWFTVVYVCCGSFLTGDLLSHYILLFLFHVLAGCQDQYFPESTPCQLENTVFLVIFVELLQKLEIYVCIIIIMMFIYAKILVGITYEEM